MAFTPEHISIEQAEQEVRQAWSRCYSPEAIASGLKKIEGRPFNERAVLFFTRLAFRGIYFPQMTLRQWLGLFFSNGRSLLRLVREGYVAHRRHRRKQRETSPAAGSVNQASGVPSPAIGIEATPAGPVAERAVAGRT